MAKKKIFTNSPQTGPMKKGGKAASPDKPVNTPKPTKKK